MTKIYFYQVDDIQLSSFYFAPKDPVITFENVDKKDVNTTLLDMYKISGNTGLDSVAYFRIAEEGEDVNEQPRIFYGTAAGSIEELKGILNQKSSENFIERIASFANFTAGERICCAYNGHFYIMNSNEKTYDEYIQEKEIEIENDAANAVMHSINAEEDVISSSVPKTRNR